MIYIKVKEQQLKEMFERGLSFQEIQRYLILHGAQFSNENIEGRPLLEKDIQESIDWQTKFQLINNEVIK